jgi:hypothetical protein
VFLPMPDFNYLHVQCDFLQDKTLFTISRCDRLLQASNDLCRDACDKTICGDILGHEGACCDDCSFSNDNTRKDSSARTYPDSLFDCDRQCSVGPCSTIVAAYIMSTSNESHLISDLNSIPNMNVCRCVKAAQRVNENVVSDTEVEPFLKIGSISDKALLAYMDPAGA